VESSPVVPQIEPARRVNLPHIGFKPFDAAGPCAQPLLSVSERFRRDVQYGHALEARPEQTACQRGTAPAHINDPAVFSNPRVFYQPQRKRRFGLKPTEFRWPVASVNPFPMFLPLHALQSSPAKIFVLPPY